MSSSSVYEMEGGAAVRVDRAGAGPPLLLLHGFTGSAATWAPLRAALGAGYTTLAADLPGHGRSPAPRDPARANLAHVADLLAAALDAAGAPRAAVLGYSLGGRAALHLALRHPGRVAALVLESASPGVEDAAARAERAAADAALADAIEHGGVPAFVDRWERLPLWASQAALPAEARARLRAERLANTAAGLAASLRAAGAGVTPPVWDQLAGLAMPTLLVAGALDGTYAAIARRVRGLMPRAEAAVVPGAGHAVHLERPAAFAERVGAFLAAHWPAAGNAGPGRLPG